MSAIKTFYILIVTPVDDLNYFTLAARTPSVCVCEHGDLCTLFFTLVSLIYPLLPARTQKA